MLSYNLEKIESFAHAHTNASTPAIVSSGINAPPPLVYKITTKMYPYNGSWHRAYENFRFPKQTDCFGIFQVWYWGSNSDDENSMCPFRLLEKKDLPYPKDNVLISKARAVLAFIISNEFRSDTAITAMTRAESKEYFDSLYSKTLEKLQSVCKKGNTWRRVDDISYVTIYDNIKALIK